jgi:hypothetical protein
VTAGGNLYLTVTGTGVTPTGTQCQLQSAQASPHGTAMSATIHPAYCTAAPCAWYLEAGQLPGAPSYAQPILDPVDRQTAATLDAIDIHQRYTCNITFSHSFANYVATNDYSRLPIFDLEDCTPLPPACNDGVKNGNETDVDCGGPCPGCQYGQACNGGSDCQSGTCSGGTCGPCNGTTNPYCGGSCSPCQDSSRCSVPSDCQSHACQLYSFPDVPSFGGLTYCAPSHCANGVKDGCETDIDCGDGSFQACMCGSCASGKTCASARGCISGICNAGVCQ